MSPASTLRLKGCWYNGISSQPRTALLSIDNDRVELVKEGKVLIQTTLDELHISPALGKTARYLSFHERPGHFEPDDQSSLEKIDKLLSPKTWIIIHRLENHLLAVALSALVVLSLIMSYGYWGIPWISKILAHQLPQDLLNASSEENIEFMEDFLLKPSALDEEKQHYVLELLKKHTQDQRELSVRLYASDIMGANAMALPNGIIIFTDDLVEMADNDAELLAILGHEIAHFNERHAMQNIIQGSIIMVSISMIIGDVSALSESLLTLPVFLTKLEYSRQFELESDRFAVTFLEKRGLDREHLINILNKLMQSNTSEIEDKDDKPNTINWQRYLSTHPLTEERIQAIREM